jgi:hypothetical protein
MAYSIGFLLTMRCMVFDVGGIRLSSPTRIKFITSHLRTPTVSGDVVNSGNTARPARRDRPAVCSSS